MQTTNDGKPRPSGIAYFFYAGLIGLMLVIVGLGYLGFRQFATAVMPQMGAFNLLALAIIAGVAAFFRLAPSPYLAIKSQCTPH